MDHPVYLDHAATTPLAPEVLDAMLPYLRDEFGNPSSIYGLARGGRRAIDDARDSVAEDLGCRPGEIIFTSGGTESVNLAVKGTALANWPRGRHVVTSRVEHLAVIGSCEYLERQGFEVTYVEVDRFGSVQPDAIAAAIRADTVLVSVQLVNNEIGTIQPVAQIGQLTRERKIHLHVDACQAAGTFALDVNELGADLLSLSAHKFYGPKGTGVLFVRRGTPFQPIQHGGSNERGRRAGTENVAGIVGCAVALRNSAAGRDDAVRYMAAMRDSLIDGVIGRIGGAHLTGHPVDRHPAFASFVIDGIEGESMLLALDARKVYASSGAACTSGTLEPSHVLTAIGLPANLAHGSLRLTTGLTNTPDQIPVGLDHLVAIVEKLRALAPARR